MEKGGRKGGKGGKEGRKGGREGGRKEKKSVKQNHFFFLAALGLHCCAQAFSSCVERGLLFVAVRGLLNVVASLVERGP